LDYVGHSIMNALAMSSSLVHAPYVAVCGSLVLNDDAIAECDQVGVDSASALLLAGILATSGVGGTLVTGMGALASAGATASASIYAGVAMFCSYAAAACLSACWGLSSLAAPAAAVTAVSTVLMAPFAFMMAMLAAIVSCLIEMVGAIFAACMWCMIVIMPLLVALSAGGVWVVARLGGEAGQRTRPAATTATAVGLPVDEPLPVDDPLPPLGIPVAVAVTSSAEPQSGSASTGPLLYPQLPPAPVGLPVCGS